jgi:hypothetical protein
MPSYECPTCGRAVTVANKSDAPHRPFCCERCKMIDLGKWFDGTYAVSEPMTPESLDALKAEEAAPPDDARNRPTGS